MYYTPDIIMQRLSEEDKKAYERIYAPKIVAVPPQDSRRAMCVLSSGEIRVYGETDKTAFHGDESTYRNVYISSLDGGLSWKEHDAEPNDIGPCVYVPWTGKYVTVASHKHPKTGSPVTCRFISNIGAGDTNPDIAPICDINYGDIFQPYVLEDCKRLIASGQNVVGTADNLHDYHPAIFISDDGGYTWTVKELPSSPRFVQTHPHKGMRWENNGSEPSLTRLKDGRLWLLFRTSQDYLYESFSLDNGDTWSAPAPSPFHMTLTTPFALTLKDERTILFWNNTHPLPEQDKRKCIPPLGDDIVRGVWEDLFTNRDIAHAAITDDAGKTFIGYRETILNPLRNESDFRKHGSYFEGNDRSVHQFQAIELPMGKILLSAGQHEEIRKLLIFDVKWLYETQREETFRDGMKNVSTHGYIKSISGSFTGKGIPGHCQWNRVYSVFPAPNPDGTPTEALQFVYSDDERLVNGISGLVWNFPTSQKGRLEIDFYRKTKGLQICLADEWINPTDEYANETAEFCLIADEKVPAMQWTTLIVEWDTETGKATCLLNGEVISTATLQHNAPFGVSNLHLQTLARSRDFEGSYVRKFKKTDL